MIGELQRGKLRQSRAKALSWNGRTRGQFLQAKRRIPSSLPRHRPHTVQSVAGSFYTREVGVLAEVSVTEQVLREISKFPEILGKLSMRKQCVPGSFLLAHVREPGNEANTLITCNRMFSRHHCMCSYLPCKYRVMHAGMLSSSMCIMTSDVHM